MRNSLQFKTNFEHAISMIRIVKENTTTKRDAFSYDGLLEECKDSTRKGSLHEPKVANKQIIAKTIKATHKQYNMKR